MSSIKTETSPRKPEEKTKTVGNYTLGSTIGEGTFGKVKLGYHLPTGEKVAVKILEKEKITDVNDVERVAREIHILKLIRHPNIIQLYEIIETPKQLYLIMEYASGGEVFEYIVANNKIPEPEAAKFFRQIISGVEYIHKLGVVHRDLKPENLLLDYNHNIKIVDFGLSNTYKNGESLKTACGSPCYAAPEMIAGKRYHGIQVDIWSCGVILYALLCGYLPFEDANTGQLYKKILSGEFHMPKHISSSAKELLKGILTTDPNKRYSINDIRSHPWYKLEKHERDPEGIIIGKDNVPVDPAIVQKVELHNHNKENIKKCIENNRHNHVTTTYYLLLSKHVRSGGQSLADISGELYKARSAHQLAAKENHHNTSKQQSINSKPSTAETNGSSSKHQSSSAQRKRELQIETQQERSVTPANVGVTSPKSHDLRSPTSHTGNRSPHTSPTLENKIRVSNFLQGKGTFNVNVNVNVNLNHLNTSLTKEMDQSIFASVNSPKSQQTPKHEPNNTIKITHSKQKPHINTDKSEILVAEPLSQQISPVMKNESLIHSRQGSNPNNNAKASKRPNSGNKTSGKDENRNSSNVTASVSKNSSIDHGYKLPAKLNYPTNTKIRISPPKKSVTKTRKDAFSTSYNPIGGFVTPRAGGVTTSIDRNSNSKVNKSLIEPTNERLNTDSGVPTTTDHNLTTEGEVIYETLNSSRQSDKDPKPLTIPNKVKESIFGSSNLKQIDEMSKIRNNKSPRPKTSTTSTMNSIGSGTETTKAQPKTTAAAYRAVTGNKIANKLAPKQIELKTETSIDKGVINNNYVSPTNQQKKQLTISSPRTFEVNSLYNTLSMSNTTTHKGQTANEAIVSNFNVPSTTTHRESTTASSHIHNKMVSPTNSMKTHKGPYNVSGISSKNPKYVMSEITRAVEQNKVYHRNTNSNNAGTISSTTNKNAHASSHTTTTAAYPYHLSPKVSQNKGSSSNNHNSVNKSTHIQSLALNTSNGHINVEPRPGSPTSIMNSFYKPQTPKSPLNRSQIDKGDQNQYIKKTVSNPANYQNSHAGNIQNQHQNFGRAKSPTATASSSISKSYLNSPIYQRAAEKSAATNQSTATNSTMSNLKKTNAKITKELNSLLNQTRKSIDSGKKANGIGTAATPSNNSTKVAKVVIHRSGDFSTLIKNKNAANMRANSPPASEVNKSLNLKKYHINLYQANK